MTKKKSSSKTSELSPEHRQILLDQVISEEGPGTILRDFETLLDSIGPKGVGVTAQRGLLPVKMLSQLNARMTHPLEVNLQRPLHASYPHINGLYLLLRVSGLSYVRGKGKKQALFMDDAVLRSWKSLNATERYFTLLETWLFRGNEEILGESGGFREAPFHKWGQLLEKIPDKGMEVSGNKERESSLKYFPGFHSIALLELFGFLSVKRCKSAKGQSWCIDSLHRTPFGDAIFRLVSKSFLEISKEYGTQEDTGKRFSQEEIESILMSFLPGYYDKYEGMEDVSPGELQPFFSPFFPEWKNNLVVPPPEFQDGTYVFKVFLGEKIWRRIAIPAKQDLDTLSSSILDAFDFDYDHLYYFAYKNRFGLTQKAYHHFMEDEPLHASEVRIGELPLRAGESMIYLYDFGDEWEFDVELERIDPVDPKVKKPVVLETQGKAPKQYHSWDDDDEWDEDDDDDKYEDEL